MSSLSGKIENIAEQISEIYTGYTTLIQYKLGRFDEDDTLEYKKKKKICNKHCPLQSSFFGIAYCDPMKEKDDARGCGCIIEAKLWSDSPCPMEKF